MKKIVLSSCLVIVLCASSLYAHDIWVTAKNGHRYTPGQVMTFIATVGSAFPVPEITIPLKRIGRSMIYFPDGTSEKLLWEPSNKMIVASMALKEPGHTLIFYEQKPNIITIPAKDFHKYLREEGLTRILEWRKEHNKLKEDASEKYTRYIYGIFHGGDRAEDGKDVQADAFQASLVLQPLEWPCTREEVRVKVVWKGRPLLYQPVLYGQKHGQFIKTKTDGQGVAVLHLKQKGLWLVKTIHMEAYTMPRKEMGKEYSYESFWAMLTFERF